MICCHFHPKNFYFIVMKFINAILLSLVLSFGLNGCSKTDVVVGGLVFGTYMILDAGSQDTKKTDSTAIVSDSSKTDSTTQTTSAAKNALSFLGYTIAIGLIVGLPVLLVVLMGASPGLGG